LRIHVHTADADATQLDSFVASASAVCIGLQTLTAKTTELNDQDFIIRSIYKDSYIFTAL